MSAEELSKYINKKIDDINLKYPNFITNEQRNNYINKNVNIEMTPEQIDKKISEIDNMYNKIVSQINISNQLTQDLDIKFQNKKIKNVDKTFGEVYKSYVIHALKLYEEIVNDKTISNNSKKQIFELRLNKYISNKKIDTNEYLLQQIKDPIKVEYAKTELFMGSESLNFESVSNLYKTFTEDLNQIVNDFEGKMNFTVMNNRPLEFDNKGKLISKIDYNFNGIKEIYDFAKEHGKKIKFHTFLWHNAIPENLKQSINKVYDPQLKREMALSFLKDYAINLSNFINQNGYDLNQIDVLNEIASDEINMGILRDSWWKDVIGKNPTNGDEYFIDVLKIVREQFPNVNLIYNDYNEYLPYKCENICKIINYIKKIETRDGIKLLDGLGLQAHYFDYIKKLDMPLSVNMIKETSIKYAQLDMPLYITEFDFNIIANQNANQLKQAFINNYVNIVDGFNMWGNSDNLTWGHTMLNGQFLNSHAIDANGKPKEIYYHIMEQMGIMNKNNQLIYMYDNDGNKPKFKSDKKIINNISFFQRSQNEIQIYQQIKNKNQIIKQQKNHQKLMNTPKAKKLKYDNSTHNNGFISTIILSLIISFICGAIFIVCYIAVGG